MQQLLDPMVVFVLGMFVCSISATTLRIFMRGEPSLAYKQPLVFALLSSLNFPVFISLIVYGFMAFVWWYTPAVFLLNAFLASSFMVKPRSEANLSLNYHLMPVFNIIGLAATIYLWWDFFA